MNGEFTDYVSRGSVWAVARISNGLGWIDGDAAIRGVTREDNEGGKGGNRNVELGNFVEHYMY